MRVPRPGPDILQVTLIQSQTTDVDGESINNSEGTKYGISLIEWMSHYQTLAQRWIYICQDHISTHSRVTHPPLTSLSEE